MFAGPVGDYLGRKMTILIGSLTFLLGGGLQTGAQTINYMYSGRCLAGVGYVKSTLIRRLGGPNGALVSASSP